MKGYVEVVKKDLEARFSWEPDDSGQEWDIEALRGLLASADVRVEVSDAVLRKALSFFASQSAKAESEVIAQGMPPVAASPLKARPSPSELPEDVEKSLENIMSDAPTADGDVTYGWAVKGGRVGTLIPAVAPRPGTALNRDPIEPLEGRPLSKDSDRHIKIEIDSQRIRAELQLRRETGNGQPLKLDEIAAAIRNSGLRGLDGPSVKASIMEFWKSEAPSVSIVLKEGTVPERGPDREIEFLVPFLEEDECAAIRERLEFKPAGTRGLASLRDFPAVGVGKMARVEKGQAVAKLGAARTGKSGKDIDGHELPGFPGNDPDIRIHEGLGWDGQQLVTKTSGLLDVGGSEDEGPTHLRIRAHSDAVIRITVSEDKIKAYVSTRLPIGSGAPVDAGRIKEEAEKAGVVKGFADEAIAEVVERSMTGEIVTGHVIAEGRLPLEGDSRLSLRIAGDPAKSPVPIKRGDLIGIIQKGGDGGWNVLGEPLMGEGGSLSIGENITRREEENGVASLLAEKGGHMTMSDGELVVKDLLDYVERCFPLPPGTFVSRDVSKLTAPFFQGLLSTAERAWK